MISGGRYQRLGNLVTIRKLRRACPKFQAWLASQPDSHARLFFTMDVTEPTFSRRRWFVTALGTTSAMLVVATAGCSTSSTSSAANKKKSRSAKRDGKRPKGPKTMGNLLVEGYIADLKAGPAQKRVEAAQELSNMGANAKQALPALESLVKNSDAKVREAAAQAIKAIRK